MSEWQPIETAPTDGTKVLIYQPSRRHAGGATWTSFTSEAEIYVCQCVRGMWFEASGEEYARFFPTHWMPLPASPQQHEDRAK